MIAGLTGPLLSHDALRQAPGPWSPESAAARAAITLHQQVSARHAAARAHLGPSSSARRVYDLIAEPLARALGYHVLPTGGDGAVIDGLLQSPATPPIVLIVSAWGASPAGLWQRAVRRGLAHQARWCLCVNGPIVRVVDAERTYARRYADFDLDATIDHPATFTIFFGLLSAAHGEPAGNAEAGAIALDRAVALCEKHRDQVRLSLRIGVQEALLHLIDAFRKIASRRHPDAHLLSESLIVVYRILFLLFAEARGLVPAWHPVYRDGYTIETLRRRIEEKDDSLGGVWETLQAISRLAHQGCRAGALRVPPFNGRLFSPSDAPLADSLPLDDSMVSRALTTLTTRETKAGIVKISYADLGVEQLGGVYEHLLDYDLAPTPRRAPALLVRTGKRKATGSFYTPRSLTDFIVRRTLAPVVKERTPEEILGLRVLDPAMGSGAFLVGACRYLAGAYEQALVREGTLAESDVTEDDRAAFRRAVAQRCLFGVDVNPMAVQLARLSLWLATLAAEKPLTFLDHHLRTGNSLVGASVGDILCHPSPGRAPARVGELPLFGYAELESAVEAAVSARMAIALTPDDTLAQVRGKEAALRSLDGPNGALCRWKMAADLWCAAWHRGRSGPGDPATYRDLLDRITRSGGLLPAQVAEPMLAEARVSAAANRFFHWTLEFPEIFPAAMQGTAAGGFDVILGNPPWEVVREDGAASGTRELRAFVRGSGQFAMQGGGHANLYQLFFERAVRLLRRGGRIGMIVPAGFATDHAAAGLRRFLLDRTSVETCAVLDNRDGIFPIHRGLRFLLLTLCASGSTAEIPLRSGVQSPGALDAVPDEGTDQHALLIQRTLVERAAGESLAMPDLRCPADVAILTHVTSRVPALSDPDGWFVHFGRELNATDDSAHFSADPRGLPIIEGKHLSPFALDLAGVSRYIPRQAAARLVSPERTFGRRRLAYREVSSSTNRSTLIAAILPAGVVSTHTVFCVKEDLDADAQDFLCGVFNSWVADYLVRMWVATHVTAAIMSRLRVPRPTRTAGGFRVIVSLSRKLSQACARRSRAGGEAPAGRRSGRREEPDIALIRAHLNAVVGRLYGLSTEQYVRVLETFPLADRAMALGLWTKVSSEPSLPRT